MGAGEKGQPCCSEKVPAWLMGNFGEKMAHCRGPALGRDGAAE